MMRCLLLLSIALLAQGAPHARDIKIQEVPLKMPQVQPKVKDTYLCVAMELDHVNPTYIDPTSLELISIMDEKDRIGNNSPLFAESEHIKFSSTIIIVSVGFKPDANKEIAHHILLYGCKTPGSLRSRVWNCGEMAHKTKAYSSGPVCESGSQIVYAWAMDAPSLKLPKDVGFKVGGNTDIRYLVMQVHYKNVDNFLPPKNEKDSSGITLETTDTPMPKRAGVYLLGTGGMIPPKSIEYMETACLFNTPITIHPFGFRTHAHVHGEVVSGYRIRHGDWTEIGRRSPKDPQMFYNVTTPGMEVRPGDILAARCTMKNDESRTVYIGATQNDEMCNFYVMFYVDGDKIPYDHSCFTSGPPYSYWDKLPFGDKMGLDHAPKTISLEPHKNVMLVKTTGGPRRNVADVDMDQGYGGPRFDPRENQVNRLLAYLNRGYDPDVQLYDNVI
ncbi:hypothetical protein FSP39_011670 [Pinctada imbricata]|uniref:peptidylglycine monooxygenase n=1 Tax=Pinctada imbricata TaxID=66713 RepID=A0AA88YE26_PINIB|nr:hypothetical protein FSP39_011670 [Pinctada imbricata]